jgi:hypothetical protein
MHKKQLALGLVFALALVVVITPASADYNFSGWPVETRANGTVNGGVFIDYVPWDGRTHLALNTTVPTGMVKLALLYTGIWGSNEYKSGWVNVSFNDVTDRNELGPVYLQGADDANPHVWCATHGKHWMVYNVTDLVKMGALNTASVSKINGSIDGRVYGIVLVVVYEGGDNPKSLQYWINDGHDALHYEIFYPPIAAHDSGMTDFAGTVDVENVTEATLTMVHLTAYEDYDTFEKGCCEKCLKYNNHALNTTMIDSNTFALNSWDVTEQVNASNNTAWYTRMDENCDDHYVGITNAILVVELNTGPVEGALDTGQSALPYPSIAGIHTGTIEVTTNMTINAIHTYPCTGTGGHTEYARIYGNGEDRSASWQGYQGDWHNLTFDGPFTLETGKTYYYEIRTGSYPQLHHQAELQVAGSGIIRCTTFTDANGKEYDKAIPAFRLYNDNSQ